MRQRWRGEAYSAVRFGRLDLHAVIRAVVNAAPAVLGDGRQRAVGTAVHLVMAHERQLEEIDIGAALDVLLHRRVFPVDDDRRYRLGFPRQARFSHLAAVQAARHAECDLGLALGNLAIEHKREVAHLAVQIERPIEDRDGKLFLRAQVLDDRRRVIMRRIDGLADVNDFVRNLTAALVEKRAQALRHGVSRGLMDQTVSPRRLPRTRRLRVVRTWFIRHPSMPFVPTLW